MRSIEFRYNRCNSTLSLVLLCGAGWVAALALHLLFLNAAGLQSGVEAVSTHCLAPFWQERPGLALAISIVPLLLLMIISVFPLWRLWLYLMDARGSVDIYSGYAIVHFRSVSVRIDAQADISHDVACWGRGGSMNRFRPVTVIYILSAAQGKFHLMESVRELCEQTTYLQRWNREQVESTLSRAMDELIVSVM